MDLCIARGFSRRAQIGRPHNNSGPGTTGVVSGLVVVTVLGDLRHAGALWRGKLSIQNYLPLVRLYSAVPELLSRA
jgi:hypothetical protein